MNLSNEQPYDCDDDSDYGQDADEYDEIRSKQAGSLIVDSMIEQKKLKKKNTN